MSNSSQLSPSHETDSETQVTDLPIEAQLQEAEKVIDEVGEARDSLEQSLRDVARWLQECGADDRKLGHMNEDVGAANLLRDIEKMLEEAA